jgi:hypothetical protein
VRALLAFLIVGFAARASAQDVALPIGWASSPQPAVSSPTAIACTDDHAFIRAWPGDVVVWDGTSASRLVAIGRNAYGRSIAAVGDDVYLQSEADIAHYDGRRWSFLPIARSPDARWGPTVASLVALDDRRVYFASTGAIGALSGAEFGLFDAGTWRELSAIDGTSASDLWTAGQGGTVMHWDGARWSREPSGTEVALTGIRAFTANDVWAWGGEVLLHRDADGFHPRMDGLSGTYGQMVVAITGRSDRVYAAGTFGIARFDGARWITEVPLAMLGSYVSGIAGACATAHQLVVVASNGTIITHALD